MNEVQTLSEIDAETNRLVALRRKANANYDLTAEHPGTERNDDGDLVQEVPSADPTVGSGEINFSTMFGPAVSRTGNVDLLVMEAELAAEDRMNGNPHIPIDAETRATAREKIDAAGLSPAWETNQ